MSRCLLMKCAYCGARENWSMMRYPWMTRIPFMKNRRCSTCGREYARWLGFISLRHETARVLVNAWVFLLLVALSVGVGLGIAQLFRMHSAMQ